MDERAATNMPCRPRQKKNASCDRPDVALTSRIPVAAPARPSPETVPMLQATCKEQESRIRVAEYDCRVAVEDLTRVDTNHTIDNNPVI